MNNIDPYLKAILFPMCIILGAYLVGFTVVDPQPTADVPISPKIHELYIMVGSVFVCWVTGVMNLVAFITNAYNEDGGEKDEKLLYSCIQGIKYFTIMLIVGVVVGYFVGFDAQSGLEEVTTVNLIGQFWTLGAIIVGALRLILSSFLLFYAAYKSEVNHNGE